MNSLRQLSSPTALVIRSGESISVPAKNVVPGDLVLIKAGDVVPADVRRRIPIISYTPIS